MVIGLADFLMMGFDKTAAKFRNWRVSEKIFWLTAVAGGFLGIIIGAIIFNHKIAKKSFWPPVIISIVLWLGFLILLR